MYEAAYAARSIDALRRVQALTPADVNTIRTAFADALDYRVTVDKLDIRFSPDGRQATVTAQASRVVTTKRGQQSNTAVSVFSLEKRGASWIIVAVR